MNTDESAKELLEPEVGGDEPRRKTSMKNKLAKEITEISRLLVAGDGELLATNESYWSWEDDADDVKAELFVDLTGALTLKVTRTHTKYGLGKGVRSAVLFDDEVGTLLKPKIAVILSVLKKYGHERTRSGTPFKRVWHSAKGSDAVLGDILRDKLEEVGKDTLKPVPTALKVDERRALRERMIRMINQTPDDELDHLAETMLNS